MKDNKSPLYVNLAYESGVIRSAQNENPYGASPRVLDAILKNINCVSLYPDFILTELKDKLAKKNRVTSDEIIVSPGSCALIDQLISRMVKDNENIVIPKLTFIVYKLCAGIHNRECRQAAMQNYYISLNNIFNLCDRKTKLIFLANPNNPTGTIFTHSQIINFLNKIPEEIFVILDEAYNEYVSDKDFPNYIAILKQYKNVIILRSFSKIYGLAGLRIGYGIAQKPVIEDLEKNKVPFSVSTISNIAALAALEDKAYVHKCVIKNAQGRELLVNCLSALGYKILPSQGNFVFVYFPTTVERDKVHAILLKNKIIVRKLEPFGDSKSLRISIGKTHDNRKILDCLSVHT